MVFLHMSNKNNPIYVNSKKVLSVHKIAKCYKGQRMSQGRYIYIDEKTQGSNNIGTDL